MVSAAIQSGICRPATIRSAGVPSRILRDASQPTTMKAPYIAMTAAMAGVKEPLRWRSWIQRFARLPQLRVERLGNPDPHHGGEQECDAGDREGGAEAARRRDRSD